MLVALHLGSCHSDHFGEKGESQDSQAGLVQPIGGDEAVVSTCPLLELLEVSRVSWGGSEEPVEVVQCQVQCTEAPPAMPHSAALHPAPLRTAGLAQTDCKQ